MTERLALRYNCTDDVTIGDVRDAFAEIDDDDVSQSSPITGGVEEAAVQLGEEDGQHFVEISVAGHEGDWTKTSEDAVVDALESIAGVEDLHTQRGGYSADHVPEPPEDETDAAESDSESDGTDDAAEDVPDDDDADDDETDADADADEEADTEDEDEDADDEDEDEDSDPEADASESDEEEEDADEEEEDSDTSGSRYSTR